VIGARAERASRWARRNCRAAKLAGLAKNSGVRPEDCQGCPCRGGRATLELSRKALSRKAERPGSLEELAGGAAAFQPRHPCDPDGAVIAGERVGEPETINLAAVGSRANRPRAKWLSAERLPRVPA